MCWVSGMFLDDMDRPSWRAHKAKWPNSEASRFVQAGGMRWHVQVAGEGPVLLMLHGTAAATHSWRDLVPLLKEHFTIVAPDLPGHGFSAMPPFTRTTLPRAAAIIGRLLTALGLKPDMVVGHSAGAAIGTRMTLDHLIEPKALVGLNGAFLPFEGPAGQIFPSMAKALFINPFAPRLFALSGQSRRGVERLIESTGSTIDADGIAQYGLMLSSAGHIAGVLAMVASWDLEPLVADMPHLETPLLLMAGARDRAVPPATARTIATKAKDAEVLDLPTLGHLAHEEEPARCAEIIVEFAAKNDVLGGK